MRTLLSNMADPLSIGASLLAVITATIQSSKALCATVQRYKGRDKTLIRLHYEVEDLVNILGSLELAIDTEASILALLKGPIDRCNHVCQEFKVAMEKFSGKSRLGLVDWARMEFMTSDINGFMETIAGYKSTIAVGIGTITMLVTHSSYLVDCSSSIRRNSKLNQQVLEEYSEMIKDTSYGLQIHLQRIDEKLVRIIADDAVSSDTSVDLQDEKAVTKQCLQICDKARSYIESLQDEQPALTQNTGPATVGIVQTQFEAQLLTNKTLNDNRNKIVETIGHLQERLDSMVSDKRPGRDHGRIQLQEDINASRQCLEVCNQAAQQVSHQKIHMVGEVVAEDDTDQVVVTTLADLFEVRKVWAKNRSAQLVGSMTDDTLQKMSTDRYNSRFGVQKDAVATSLAALEITDNHTQPRNQWRNDKQPTGREKDSEKPMPNQMKKRTIGRDNSV